MATDVDVFAIKEKIVDILDSNATIFDATGANSKVRKIDKGAPRMREELILETTLPHIWVTNDSTIDVVSVRHSTQSNAPLITEHTIGLKIILLAQEGRGALVEEVLDDFVKLITEEITENFDLRTPAGAESTSVADKCVVTRVEELSSRMSGKARQGRVIHLTCKVTTA